MRGPHGPSSMLSPGRLRFARSSPKADVVVTPRQKQVLDYIRQYNEEHGVSPTLEEIGQHLQLGSLATVHKHLRGLEERGAIRRLPRQSRALEIVEPGANDARAVKVPLLGRVAAGTPIEAIEDQETVTLPEEMLGRRETFTLRVQGDSMIEDGILDGDIVVVERQNDAPNGATVVALVNGEATVKRFQRKRGRIHLIPANAALQPIIANEDEVELRGIVIGLMRRYR